MPLSLSLWNLSLQSLKAHHSGLLSHLWSSLSQLRSFIVNVAATKARCHQPTSRHPPQTHIVDHLKPTLPIGVLARGCWVPNWETHGACRPSPSSDPTHRRCACLWFLIGDFLFFLWWVILFGLGWGKRLEIWVFFFFAYCGLLLVVVVVVLVVVGVADGRCGCGWCCDCFLDSEIYYFIVVIILIYCDIYFILLYWKLK